jgi:calcium-dependent protein kinase
MANHSGSVVIMGNICSGKVTLDYSIILPKQPLKLYSKEDLQFNSGTFVQENHESFSSIYKLHSKPIGSGAFAEVWLCDHMRSGETRAVKILHKSGVSEHDIRMRSVFLEVEILKTLDHPNVLKVYEYFEDEEDYYIVMEYCPGGDVFDKLESVGTFTERYAARIMKYLLSGLAYLHSRHVVHRDIKPENLLITNGQSFDEFSIKIIDFNVATRKENEKLSGVTGTTDYMAPEVFRGVYDEKCDLWSAGVILYMLVSGCLPFPCPNEEEAERNICNGKFSFPNDIFAKVSKECKDLITKLLNKNQNSRPSALEALSHPWFKLSPDRCDNLTMQKTLTRMKTVGNQGKQGKLQELFKTFIISQVSANSSTRKLEKVFAVIDQNKDGVISEEELLAQLSKEMSLDQAKAQVTQIFEKMDSDGSGVIEYCEYLRIAIEEESLLSRENLRKAFCYFDKDNSQTIEKGELVAWLSTGDMIPESIIQDLIEEADLNGDGTIDLEEFEQLLADKFDL